MLFWTLSVNCMYCSSRSSKFWFISKLVMIGLFPIGTFNSVSATVPFFQDIIIFASRINIGNGFMFRYMNCDIVHAAAFTSRCFDLGQSSSDVSIDFFVIPDGAQSSQFPGDVAGINDGCSEQPKPLHAVMSPTGMERSENCADGPNQENAVPAKVPLSFAGFAALERCFLGFNFAFLIHRQHGLGVVCCFVCAFCLSDSAVARAPGVPSDELLLFSFCRIFETIWSPPFLTFSKLG